MKNPFIFLFFFIFSLCSSAIDHKSPAKAEGFVESYMTKVYGKNWELSLNADEQEAAIYALLRLYFSDDIKNFIINEKECVVWNNHAYTVNGIIIGAIIGYFIGFGMSEYADEMYPADNETKNSYGKATAFFSPDSNYIIIASPRWIKVADVYSAQKTLTLLPDSDSKFDHVAFTQNGLYILASTKDHIYQWHINGGLISKHERAQGEDIKVLKTDHKFRILDFEREGPTREDISSLLVSPNREYYLAIRKNDAQLFQASSGLHLRTIPSSKLMLTYLRRFLRK